MLTFIREFIEKNQYSPTYQEIADGLKLASLATVHKHLQALKSKNYVRYGFNAARSLEIVEQTSSKGFFYIQNVGFIGNTLKFWRPDGHGYTTNLDEAWKVSQQDAANICRSRPNEDIPLPQVCVERLREAQRESTTRLDRL